MKRIAVLALCLCLLLAGCKQKGFETDIDLSEKKPSEQTSSSQSQEQSDSQVLDSSPSSGSSSDLVIPAEPSTGDSSDSLPPVTLSSTPLTNAEMTDIYGVTWNYDAQEKLTESMDNAGIYGAEMTLHRACYLLNINPLGLTSMVAWYGNTTGEMFIYFTYPASSQRMMNTALSTSARQLKDILQPNFEGEDKERFDHIRYAASSTQAYFIIPGAWTGPTTDFRLNFRDSELTLKQNPPFSVEGLNADVSAYRFIADQAESVMIETFGFPDKGLGAITPDMDINDYLLLTEPDPEDYVDEDYVDEDDAEE